MKKLRIIGGFLDTRTNKEDFALTPYLSVVYVKVQKISIHGLALCWGFYSVYIGIGCDLPDYCPSFKVKKYKP